jgi:hypothetical protein
MEIGQKVKHTQTQNLYTSAVNSARSFLNQFEVAYDILVAKPERKRRVEDKGADGRKYQNVS